MATSPRKIISNNFSFKEHDHTSGVTSAPLIVIEPDTPLIIDCLLYASLCRGAYANLRSLSGSSEINSGCMTLSSQLSIDDKYCVKYFER